MRFIPPSKEITGSVEGMGRIHFELVRYRDGEQLWRYLIQSYHYLGYRRAIGRYLKYFVYLGNELVALIRFADGVYNHHLRDGYLGWDREELEEKRHLVVNNFRFLILPWVRVENLGSRILSEAQRVVPFDWERLYGFRPLYFKTFVDGRDLGGQFIGQLIGFF